MKYAQKHPVRGWRKVLEVPSTLSYMKKSKLEKISEESEFSRVEEGVERDLGIIVSGNTYSFLKGILVSLKLNLLILNIGFVNPAPYTKILEFSK